MIEYVALAVLAACALLLAGMLALNERHDRISVRPRHEINNDKTTRLRPPD